MQGKELHTRELEKKTREKEEAGAPIYHSVVPTSEARQGGPSLGPHRNGSSVHATMALSVTLVHVARPKGLDMKIVFRLRSENCFQEWLVIKC